MGDTIESRLDQILSRISGGGPTGPTAPSPPRDVARMVKRTEVATAQHKRSLVKYVVVGVAIILLLVAAIYFVANTSHGKAMMARCKNILSSKTTTQKRKSGQITSNGNPPSRVPHTSTSLVAQEVDFRSRGQAGQSTPPVQVRVPHIPKDQVTEGNEPEELDPGAVRFTRRTPRRLPPRTQPNQPTQPTRPHIAHTMPPPPSMNPQPKRTPTPPIDDSGPPPTIAASGYEND